VVVRLDERVHLPVVRVQLFDQLTGLHHPISR
jgi:hypothetical protein